MKAVNFKIQSHRADRIKLAAVRLKLTAVRLKLTAVKNGPLRREVTVCLPNVRFCDVSGSTLVGL